MSTNFCANCGKQKESGQFCANCGFDFEGGSGPAKQVAPQQQPTRQPRQQQNQYQQPVNPYAQQGTQYARQTTYQRPPDYVFTKTMSERIVGTLKFDVHVVEEIEERNDLNDEAKKLFIANLGLISVLQIVLIFSLPEFFEVHSEIGTVVEVFLTTILGGFVLVYLIAELGKRIGGHQTNTSTEEILRVLSYAYVARSILTVMQVLSQISGELIISLIFLISAFYYLFVFVFVIKRALDRGLGVALITIVIASILASIVSFTILILVDSIFGGTYGVIPT